MNSVLRVLTALALVLPAAAFAAPPAPRAPNAASGTAKQTSRTPKKASRTPKKASGTAKRASTVPKHVIVPSEAATRVADWVSASGDNHSLPYAIIDKTNAAMFLFDGKGEPLAQVPVLVGIAAGDEATPGIGSKKLAEIGPAEKTTPAGRFLAKFGIPFRKERILWVDYATSVALHPIPADASKKEKRRDRMLSPTPEDNRITFGCINVPSAFYANLLRPKFLKKGGYVYILPDTKPLEEVFPRLRVQALTNVVASR